MINTRFRIVGKLKAPKEGLEIIDVNSDSKWVGKSMIAYIQSGKNNFRLKFFGGDNQDPRNPNSYEDKHVKVYQGKEVIREYDIPYEERFDPALLKDAPLFMKKTIIMNKLRQDFIYSHDFIQEVKTRFDELAEKTVVVTGEVSFSESNGKIYTDFNVNNIYEAKEEDGVVEKETARGTMQTFFSYGNGVEGFFTSKKKLDVKTLAEIDNTFEIDAYVESRNQDKSSKQAYPTLHYPIKLKFAGNKMDLENNAEHLVIAEYMLSNFNVKDDDKIYKMTWDVIFVSGREEIQMTEEDIESLLSDEEKLFIKRFPAKRDEFIARKTGQSLVGEFKNEIKLFEPNVAVPFKVEAEEVDFAMLELYKSLKQSAPKKQPSQKTNVQKDEAPVSGNVVDALFDAD